MTAFDVFNGDADGICSLIQLRLAAPKPEAINVTGVKRDISLLKRVSASAGDQVTVLDISLDKNRDALRQLLERGAEVHYIDHHFAGEVPEHPGLTTRINTEPNVCTSMLVNRELQGQFIHWAIAGTLGDNLASSAQVLADKASLSSDDFAKLQSLGTCINYNAYGATIDDLHFPPEDLYQRLLLYPDPLAFVDDDKDTFPKLSQGYVDDLARARGANRLLDLPHAAVVGLPNEPWSRRVSGVFGNELANDAPDCAHAVVTEGDQGLLVSVRAPINRRYGADDICRQFETGGGRKAAAGINQLPADQLDRFIQTFSDYYASRA